MLSAIGLERTLPEIPQPFPHGGSFLWRAHRITYRIRPGIAENSSVFYNFNMSLPIHVEAYSGYRANERPLSFSVDIATGENGITGVYDIEAVEDRWYDPNAEYFKARTIEGKRYILRYAERENLWTLQSDFTVRSCWRDPTSRWSLSSRRRFAKRN